MKFDIWTFLFQIINFFVLLLVLKRILYRPIREILQKRRDLVKEEMDKAERLRNEALELKERHSREMAELGELRERMTDEMKADALAEKKKLMAAAEREAAERVEKAMALLDLERERFRGEMKEQAIETVRIFSGNILRDIADEQLHRSVWRKFLGELDGITREMAGRGVENEILPVELISAYPVSEEDMEVFRGIMEKELPGKTIINSVVDHALVAGVKIRMGDMVYDSSLSGQVAAFALKLRESA